ncbi:methyltransferase domain protein [Synechococcus sp. A18-40]|nr:methyltransferase domain protein [Synechococcus sp. A18-40]
MHNTQILYRSAGIPAMQNKLYPNKAEALKAPSASLELAQDKTGLVFNRCFDPAVVTYDESYQNDQGYSSQFQEHLIEISGLCRRYLNGQHKLVVDVGCGKGGFVELLRSQGVNALGYDNAYQGSSPYIRKSFFSKDSHDQGDLLTLRHVLEHVLSPWQFLEGIAAANEYKGLLYVEVPDLEWILKNHAYFDLFHEHVNYFRAEDFSRRFGEGVVFQCNSFGGQYLSVVINLECVRDCGKMSQKPEDIVGLQSAFSQLSAYEDQAYDSFPDSHEVVIWGAASKGVIFAAKAPPAIKSKMAYAIDINPRKQGHFMPISGVEVLGAEEGVSRLDPSSLLVIMNPNYEQEIRRSLPHNQPCLVIR